LALVHRICGVKGAFCANALFRQERCACSIEDSDAGRVSKEELKACLDPASSPLAPGEIDDIFEFLDTDADAFISLAEFLSYFGLSPPHSKPSKETNVKDPSGEKAGEGLDAGSALDAVDDKSEPPVPSRAVSFGGEDPQPAEIFKSDNLDG
jgi:hypothetical protein